MTSYASYDQGLPCKNPNCKSEGKPHPNCKCYGDMAEGGEVKHFCESNRMHEKKCQYFAEGGEVSPISTDDAMHGYIAQHGMNGLINLHKENDPKKYRDSIKNGQKKIEKSIAALFHNGDLHKKDVSKDKEKIHDWMKQGGVDNEVKQKMIEQNQSGIPQTMIENLFPEHNMGLQASKGLASNYLNGLRPQQNSPKLAFDPEPDQRNKEKVYDRAKSIAADPLRVLHHIRNGTIDKEHILHLNGMYPQLNQAIQQGVTRNIIEMQLKNQKPSQRVRQGLSLLMGTPLSSEFTPQNIMAAQRSIQPQQTPQTTTQPKQQTRKQKLSKSDQSFLTSSQSLVERQQRVH